MASARDLLVKVNPLVLPDTILGTFRYADWQGAQQQGGIIGLVGEATSSALGTNTEPFFVPESSGWRASDLEALLLRHGIRIWGAGCFNGELFFRVKKRQAHWAQYVMLRAGVPLLHGLLPGTRANPPVGNGDTYHTDTAEESSSTVPTSLERFLDQIASWFD